jgi:hypothetical protein
MKDQQAREEIQDIKSQLLYLHTTIQAVEERLNSKIQEVYQNNRITDLRKENAELKEKLNAKNK